MTRSSTSEAPRNAGTNLEFSEESMKSTRRLYAAGHWMPKSYDRHIEARRAQEPVSPPRWTLVTEVYGLTPLGGVWEGK